LWIKAELLLLHLVRQTYHPSAMESIDQQEQWHQLRNTYCHMTEDELCRLAEDARDLTPIAAEALQAEIRDRGLKIQLSAMPPLPDPVDLPDDGLVAIDRLWDEADVRRVKGILDAASIPSYLGPDNVFELEDFKLSFDAGVDLKVRAVDWGHAHAALAGASSEQSDEEDTEDDKDYAVRCPKCRSTEVLLEGNSEANTSPTPDAKYNWQCDACGHHWTDEGIATPC
jgi:hypothetical protein